RARSGQPGDRRQFAAVGKLVSRGGGRQGAVLPHADRSSRAPDSDAGLPCACCRAPGRSATGAGTLVRLIDPNTLVIEGTQLGDLIGDVKDLRSTKTLADATQLP